MKATKYHFHGSTKTKQVQIKKLLLPLTYFMVFFSYTLKAPRPQHLRDTGDQSLSEKLEKIGPKAIANSSY